MKPFSLSVKVVVRDNDGRCLLLKRSMKSKANAGKWELPGGKIDPGESFDQALIREVCEETGLDIVLEHVAGSAESESPSVRIAYIIMEASTERNGVQLSDEHDDFVWVALEELLQMDLAEQFLPFAREYARKTD